MGPAHVVATTPTGAFIAVRGVEGGKGKILEELHQRSQLQRRRCQNSCGIFRKKEGSLVAGTRRFDL